MEKAVKCAHPEVTVAGYEMERKTRDSLFLLSLCPHVPVLAQRRPPQSLYSLPSLNSYSSLLLDVVVLYIVTLS